MSLFSRVLDATASPEAKAVKTEEKLDIVGEIPGNEVLGIHVTPLPETAFRRLLCQERKRSERSRKSFVLMLVQQKTAKPHAEVPRWERIAKALGGLIRETDTLGWLELNSVLGVIFSELGDAELSASVESIESKMLSGLHRALQANQVEALKISFYSYPRSWKDGGVTLTLDPVLYPDLFDSNESKRASLLLKRLIDIVGSASALIVLAPVFAILALLIKLTSKGPVFFRQQRLGQFQVPFAFLKFRSMHVTTDAEIHREYVKNFIAGRAEPNPANGRQRRVYKLTNDPRVTWIGKFMRRTSLDEIPQFWNVLVGQMSLVGPRPPIGYEIEVYEIWHRRRLVEAKPGITGLWQVHGRSRTTFDEMVRLDLRYSRMCSPLSDLKILLQTPRAVFSGDGAY
jgi:lipopolysaccharide/colanic/teichoic acid biosynthesis glycosyltransferase